MGMEDLVRPAVVAELKDTDMPIGGSASKETAALMRGPGDHVHGRGVKGKIKHLGP